MTKRKLPPISSPTAKSTEEEASDCKKDIEISLSYFGEPVNKLRGWEDRNNRKSLSSREKKKKGRTRHNYRNIKRQRAGRKRKRRILLGIRDPSFQAIRLMAERAIPSLASTQSSSTSTVVVVVVWGFPNSFASVYWRRLANYGDKMESLFIEVNWTMARVCIHRTLFRVTLERVKTILHVFFFLRPSTMTPQLRNDLKQAGSIIHTLLVLVRQMTELLRFDYVAI